jgi:hypothetical protein
MAEWTLSSRLSSALTSSSPLLLSSSCLVEAGARAAKKSREWEGNSYGPLDAAVGGASAERGSSGLGGELRSGVPPPVAHTVMRSRSDTRRSHPSSASCWAHAQNQGVRHTPETIHARSHGPPFVRQRTPAGSELLLIEGAVPRCEVQQMLLLVLERTTAVSQRT